MTFQCKNSEKDILEQ